MHGCDTQRLVAVCWLKVDMHVVCTASRSLHIAHYLPCTLQCILCNTQRTTLGIRGLAAPNCELMGRAGEVDSNRICLCLGVIHPTPDENQNTSFDAVSPSKGDKRVHTRAAMDATHTCHHTCHRQNVDTLRLRCIWVCSRPCLFQRAACLPSVPSGRRTQRYDSIAVRDVVCHISYGQCCGIRPLWHVLITQMSALCLCL